MRSTMSVPAPLTDPPLVDRLTPRERAFIKHPDVATDPQGAALAVGYSLSVAKTQAYRMRKELDFYISYYENQRMARVNATAERVRQELADIAFADIEDYYDTVDIDGETIKVLRDPRLLPAHMRRAIKSINYETIMVDKNPVQKLVSIELHGKLDALRQLIECFGMKGGKLSGGGEDDAEQRALLDQLEPEELETMTRIYKTAGDRARAAANKKRDARAIPGEPTNGKK